MPWSAIIAYLLSLFGPALKELIQQWLRDLLNQASADMNQPVLYGKPMDQHWALFSKAIQLHEASSNSFWDWLPWSKHARRKRLLVRLRESSGQTFLTTGDQQEIRSLSQAAT